MNLELTDRKRYELEKDNLVALLLAAARSQTPTTPEIIAGTLKINMATADRLIAALQNDQIIK